MIDVYLGLGSNLGDRRDHLAKALDRLPAHGVRVARVSPVVESPAMLPDDAPTDWNRPFLNIVAHCRTDASPADVLDGLKANGVDNNGEVEKAVNARVCDLCARFPIYAAGAA